MARRVFLHLGLPKTATTYLQRILWSHQDELRDQGMLLPGVSRREHLWVTRTIRGERLDEGMNEHQRGAWDRIRAEIAAWPGDAVVSHEFLAAATTGQARRTIEQLAPAEVHLVLTAREPLGLFAASWQESLKNRGVESLSEYAREVSPYAADIWNWRGLDLGLVLQRWAPEQEDVPPENVHVLPLPGREHPRELIWERFAGVLDLDPHAVSLEGHFPNESMGVVEAETLRRINEHLDGFETAIDRGTYIRTYLADEWLVPRKGERFWPGADQIDDARRRGEAAVALIRQRGFDLVGSEQDLLVPETLPERRHPDDVTDAEVAGVATELVGRMLEDVRALRHERRELRDALAKESAEVDRQRDTPALRMAVHRLRLRFGRSHEPYDGVRNPILRAEDRRVNDQ